MFKKITKTKTSVSPILTEDSYYPPDVFITYEALIKMKSYVMQHDKEIGWLGYVNYEPEKNSYTIYDVVLMKQNVSSVTTELSESGLQEYAEKLISEGKIDELNKVRCWGHSHVNMSTSPSAQDNATFEEYYKTCDFFIRIIANKKEDLKLDIAIKSERLIYRDVEWKILWPEVLKNYAVKISDLRDQLERLEKENDEFEQNSLDAIKDAVKEEIKNKVSNFASTKQSLSPYQSYFPESYGEDMYDDYEWYKKWYGKKEQETTEIGELYEEDLYLKTTIPVYSRKGNENGEQEIDTVLAISEIRDIYDDKASVDKIISRHKQLKPYTQHDKQELYLAALDYGDLAGWY